MVLRRISGVFFAIVVSFGAPSAGMAQDLSQVQAPAEFPPFSYSGTQYVDSRGCVFVRAGIDGAVTWVPRVTRQRVPICGAEPTFSAAERALPVIPDPPGTPAPGSDVAEAPATQVIVPEVVATRPRTPTKETPVVVATPKLETVAVAPAPAPKAAAPVVVVETPVRTVTPAVAPSVVSPEPRPAPTVVATPRRATPVPEGYQRIRVSKVLDVSGGLVPAWKDGRLNPNRGLPKVAERVSTKVAPQPVAPAARAPEATAGRYVQVATFGVRSNAEATARRLAKKGQPVRLGTVTRKGQPYTLVMMGPFASSSALSKAVAVARGAGFADAFVR